MKEQILKMLLEANGYISGEEMSKVVGVSRAAVWKQIQKIKDEGFEIVSVTNRGYKIISHPDIFSSEELKYLLGSCSVVDEIYTFDTIDSTNHEAKRRAEHTDVNTALVISEEQTSGKGRRGRNWVSKHGTGIFMSLLLRPMINPANASMITLLAGIAVQRGILKATGLECKIKWPNDLVLNGKKISGILTEMSTEVDEIHYVVVGIGINVNNEEIDDEIKAVATSLALEANKKFLRKEIVVEVLKQFEVLYNVFVKTETLDFILEEYNNVCINVNKEVKVEMNHNIITGKAIKVNGMGNLIMKTNEGEELSITSGEVSVRGLYGYVD